MVVQKEFLQRLKQDFKLNIYEVKIWTAILSRSIATAGELADISGVPRSRCYDVLESFEKKGFIIMKIGRPIKYIAVQPEEILERVKKSVREDVDKTLEIIGQIQTTDVFKELELLHKTGIEHVDPVELSNALVGRENLNYFIKHFVEKAEKKVLIVTSAEGFKRKTQLLKNIVQRLLKRGIKIKIVAPFDHKEVKRLDGVELENRNHSFRFIVVDSKEVLFMTTSDEVNPAHDTGIWLKSEFFTKAMQKMFEEYMIAE